MNEEEPKYNIVLTSMFKKDLKLAKKALKMLKLVDVKFILCI